MTAVDNERPPYVTFERRAIEDRSASVAAGHYVARDVDYILVTRPGSRDTLEAEAQTWIDQLRNKVRGGLVPENWLQAIEAAYKRFQNDEAEPENGTAIKNWPILSPAAKQTLLSAGFRTVEDLADSPDNEVTRIGVGGLSYKLKAKAWLEAAENAGKSTERINALVQQISDLTATVNGLVERNKELEALVPKAKLSSKDPL